MRSHALPSAQRLLTEASDLAYICTPRELSTYEIFDANAYYGNDYVIKLYANWPLDRPLKLVVPHGSVLNSQYIWDAERQARLPAVLAYSEDRARAYRQHTRKFPISSAPPLAYIPGLMGLDASTDVPRRGTLFFPSHSTHHLTAHTDFEGLAESLLRLDERLQPVTVCIYWRDYELGRHLPFHYRGLRVVSAGHIYDREFLFRLYFLCRSHLYAASNSLGTHLAYSLISGCTFFYHDGFDVLQSGTNEFLRTKSKNSDDSLQLKEVFSEPVMSTTESQYQLVSRLYGIDRVLSPQRMRQVLSMTDRIDKYGVAISPVDGGLQFGLPWKSVRSILRIGRTARRAMMRKKSPESAH